MDGSLHLSGEEDEDFSSEDHLGSLEETSPTSDSAYVSSSRNNIHGSTPPVSVPGAVPSTQSFNSLETLSMPMTLSHAAAVNAGGMM